MAESAARPGHVAFRVLVGLAYVAAGLLVLVAQIRDVTLQWSIVAPVVMLLLGLGLLVTALVDTHLRENAAS